WVIEYDLASQLALFKRVGSAFEGAADAAKGAFGSAKQAARLAGPVSLAIALAIGLVLWQRRRRRLGLGRPRNRPRPRPRSPIAQIYDDVARTLAKSGTRREAFVTPRELADGMAARGAEGAHQLGELTELYYAAEWGRRRDPAAEQRARALADELRALLGATRRASR